MKRAKRQVAQRTTAEQNVQNNKITENFQNVPEPSKQIQMRSQQANIDINKQSSEAEEKKRKIQLLKQKYLNKNKTNAIPTTNNTSVTIEPQIQKVEKVEKVENNQIFGNVPKTETIPEIQQKLISHEKTQIQSAHGSANDIEKARTQLQGGIGKYSQEREQRRPERQETFEGNSVEQGNTNLQIYKVPNKRPPPPPALGNQKKVRGNPPPPPPINRKKTPIHKVEIPPSQPQQPQSQQSKISEDKLPVTKSIDISAHGQISSTFPDDHESYDNHESEKAAQITTKEQKIQTNSFAPPSDNSFKGHPIAPKKSNSVKVPPPPPPNKNMKQFLNRKLNSQKNTVPPKKPSQYVEQVQPLELEVEKASLDDHDGKCSTHQEYNQEEASTTDIILSTSTSNQTKRQSPNMNIMNKKIKPPKPSLQTVELDEQYQQNHHQPVEEKEEKATKSPSSHIPSIQQLINSWMSSPELTLTQLYPSQQDTIELYCLGKSTPLSIASTHPNFNPTISLLVNSFMINNQSRFTQNQKESAQELCLNYFNTNANKLNDVFLICLIKMGSTYLMKYKLAIEEKISYYLSRVIVLKNVLLLEEVSQFVEFCIDERIVQMVCFYKLLMLAPGSRRVLEFFNGFDFFGSDQDSGPSAPSSNVIALLCICRLQIDQNNSQNRKSSNNPSLNQAQVMGLYLKLLGMMIPSFNKYGMIEKTLNHMKGLDIPENLYQFYKQLTKAMLKSYDSSVENSQNGYSNGDGSSNNFTLNCNPHSHPKMDNPNAYQQPSFDRVNNNTDKSLFGYFNINKAIDKIKESTSNVTKSVIKPIHDNINNVGDKSSKQTQDEEKKDDIVYDSVRKRYLINGTIPKDENDNHDLPDAPKVRKAPPPPPLGGGKSKVQPGGPEKKGVRGNVQRYA